MESARLIAARAVVLSACLVFVLGCAIEPVRPPEPAGEAAEMIRLRLLVPDELEDQVAEWLEDQDLGATVDVVTEVEEDNPVDLILTQEYGAPTDDDGAESRFDYGVAFQSYDDPTGEIVSSVAQALGEFAPDLPPIGFPNVIAAEDLIPVPLAGGGTTFLGTCCIYRQNKYLPCNQPQFLTAFVPTGWEGLIPGLTDGGDTGPPVIVYNEMPEGQRIDIFALPTSYLADQFDMENLAGSANVLLGDAEIAVIGADEGFGGNPEFAQEIITAFEANPSIEIDESMIDWGQVEQGIEGMLPGN